ncbi:MAG TPA: hypothetical protein PKJ93_01850 [Methanoculleus sp.]|jgi:hypothetical protein|uniref:hypothetical protein n=1 Tax=Methanoculleus sp. TaxID=90427 RepID=UPI002B939526|nr:hypothetical protein [Methanoculleus sp.]HNQ32500.1 hypothetical protein [Methanoculleus sp.]HNT06676.1 hypothetical protein [Methanoculleus sp.]HOF96909.1 hypothetical protein [Methanoculleus sp.]
MPRVRINEGDLVSGAGVEGRRKKKIDESPEPPREEPAGKESAPVKKGGRPSFGDADGADIFFTRK